MMFFLTVTKYFCCLNLRIASQHYSSVIVLFCKPDMQHFINVQYIWNVEIVHLPGLWKRKSPTFFPGDWVSWLAFKQTSSHSTLFPARTCFQLQIKLATCWWSSGVDGDRNTTPMNVPASVFAYFIRSCLPTCLLFVVWDFYVVFLK